MLKNEVKLEGVRNARELGRFPVGTKVVKKDVLIRTGTLEHAKEDAIRVLNEQYRVQAIIDFRMTGEGRKAPDPEVPGAKKVHLPGVEFEDYITKLGDPELARHYLSQNMSREEMTELSAKQESVYSWALYEAEEAPEAAPSACCACPGRARRCG